MASTASHVPSSVVLRSGRRNTCRPTSWLRIVRGAINLPGLVRPPVRRFTAVAAASAGRTEPGTSLSGIEREETSDRRLSADKIDEWVQESIIEIVRHIGEAPFLVHIFSNGSSSLSSSSSSDAPPSPASSLRLQREAARPEDWPSLQKRWQAAPPDSVILVEELAGEEDDGAATAAEAASKTWGLLVQGRGADCAACYILRTCRVRSPAGFCTHFCLAKANCFGDSAAAQLRRSWLLPQS